MIPNFWNMNIDVDVNVNSLTIDGLLTFDPTRDGLMKSKTIWIRLGELHAGTSA
jgi:hypothetical protein